MSSRGRRRLVLGAVVVAVVGVAALFMRLGARDTPDERAAVACALIEDFGELVRDDGPVEDVFAVLDEAEIHARLAREGHPRWVALEGAVGALRVALEEDDVDAASVAVRTATAECGAEDS